MRESGMFTVIAKKIAITLGLVFKSRIDSVFTLPGWQISVSLLSWLRPPDNLEVFVSHVLFFRS